ncbi:MAG: ATP-binding protein, partial [Deltaproteobacteria bacterium]|nr:ATP-binding protein [Deltaproteobacteria bacterium]
MTTYPFSAITGQDKMKLALILNAIDPRIGGVLIRGEKGTAKSTAVRGLAALLPEIRVVEGCPYCCNPDYPARFCRKCKESSAGSLKTAQRKVRVVDLPLNATEDMVLGGIDFGFAVKSGYRRFQQGLLADANRGILYIDEVNLLDDHIVDVILDASGSGENVVEREGISFRHPACFILVGTMNPEEGELRPQFLDRFGLCVQVEGEADPEKRVDLMQKREAYDNNPKAFLRNFEKEEKRIADQIVRSRKILSDMRLSKELRTFITELCLKNNVAGHRADIVIERTALALAAYEGRLKTGIDDVNQAALLALPHRSRDAMPPPSPEKPEENSQDSGKQNQEKQQEKQQHDQEEKQAPNHKNPEHKHQDHKNQSPEEKQEADSDSGELSSDKPDHSENETGTFEQIFETGTTFKVRKIALEKDHVLRRGSGRRSRTRTAQKQGRYVKSGMPKGRNDIALDATLRAAAPYQVYRCKEHDNDDNLTVFIREEDIREKVREKRVGNFILFLVDASGSMGARARMVASKGAILSLLLDAYQKRDKVAMVSFSHRKATVNLPPTSSI